MNQIKCHKIKEMIMEYVDGFLRPEKKDILFLHISQCQNCKKYLENIEKIRFYISKLKVKEPDYLESKIMAKIDSIEEEKERRNIFNFGFILKPAFSYTIGFVMVLTTIFLLYNKTNDLNISTVNIDKNINITVKEKIDKKSKNFKIIEQVQKIQKENEKSLISENKVENNEKNNNEENKNENNKIFDNTRIAIIKENTNDKKKIISEPNYLLSKTDNINYRIAKGEISPSITNPLLEREKAIIANNTINPLKGEYCTIKVKVEQESRVKIIIYDKRIKVIANLIDEQKGPGVYEVKWYGKNSAGEILSEGVYFVYIQIGNQIIKKNVIIIK